MVHTRTLVVIVQVVQPVSVTHSKKVNVIVEIHADSVTMHLLQVVVANLVAILVIVQVAQLVSVMHSKEVNVIVVNHVDSVTMHLLQVVVEVVNVVQEEAVVQELVMLFNAVNAQEAINVALVMKLKPLLKLFDYCYY